MINFDSDKNSSILKWNTVFIKRINIISIKNIKQKKTKKSDIFGIQINI